MDGLGSVYFVGKRIFKDLRLDARLHRMFEQAVLRPEGTLPQKLRHKSQLMAAYRMLNHPEVHHQAILRAHRDCCLEQLRDYKGRLLILHDTTVLDYSGLDIEELGQIGDGHGRGLYGHNSLAVIAGERRVVGLFHQILHRREHAPKGERRGECQARAGRESRLWRDAVAALPALPEGIEVTDVSDRGSDISEYIAYEVSHGRKFIVRSQHNRNLAGADGSILKLHQQLRGLKPVASYTLQVPGKEEKRRATIGIAWQGVQIIPPRQQRGEHGREPLKLWGVIAAEQEVPAGEEPIEWILLTNVPIESREAAGQCIDDYCCRWMVEDYHKAMKTGSGIEAVQLTSLHALENFIAVTSVLAVHVLKLRNLARDPATAQEPALKHEPELKVKIAARHARHPDWQAMTLGEYYLTVAHLGGYVANPRKRPPGWIVLWRGYTLLNDMAQGILLMKDV